MWIDAYDAVTTQAGRYVQGGGCTTVGVAGLVQSGGFGSFSKKYGTAAAGLIEAEVVTADGVVRIANACSNPELFWGLKGGGGGSLGVLTRLTLRTRELPETFGAAFGAIKASSDAAFRALIAKVMSFYRSELFNPHWGEQMVFQSDNTLRISMVFQGLSQAQAQQVWAPFLDWVRARKEYALARQISLIALPARHFWDADFFRQHAPQFIVEDSRPGAPRDHILWAGDQAQVGWFLHGFRSAWLPASLLQDNARSRLVDAMFAASREQEFALHFNKGLAGAPPQELAAARDTATHPGMVEAFALAMCGADGAPAYPGMPGPGPDLAKARRDAAGVGRSMDALLMVAPRAGSYVSESDYFERDWQTSFWGSNYSRLAAVKRRYDPEGLFFVHHGVGSEAWSADGFVRRA
jgi:FAD/FMN-containing dehydrogenase